MSAHIIFWLFFILPFSIINSSSIDFMVNSYYIRHQRSFLLDLKNNLIFDPTKSSKLAHWDHSEYDCCQWHGVTCKEGHVTALDLSHESISGGLNDSSSLFRLQYLESLNLAFNNFHSVIPQELQNLQNLMYLNLSHAGFEGQVPEEISHLKKLVTLDLSSSLTPHHRLKLEKPNIAMLVKNFTDITELYLDGVAISATGEEWGRALSSLEGLRVLSMSSCNLSGPIDTSLANLESLSVLKLSHNKLNGSFTKDIFHIQTLKLLDISENQYLDGFLPHFPPFTSLEYLNLANTNFSGTLPNTISNLKQLSTIDLSYCQFNGTLPSSISELTQLVYLDFSSNNLTGPLPSFNMSKNLTYLSLFFNHLSGDLPSSHFEGLVNLVSFNLGFNSFIGNLPSSVLKLPYLRELKLPYNQLSGNLSEFENASTFVLEMIDLTGNNLHGPIPFSVFNLRKLRFIQLSYNKFNGTINLDIIRRLSNLTFLGLSHNNLSVNVNFRDDHNMSPFPNMRILWLESCKMLGIPSFLRNQSTAISLQLSENMIEGPIPNWIWNLDSLINLNLSRNFLTSFEGSFSNSSSNLFVVDLSFNQLQGPIPFIPRYTNYLDYSSNRLSSIIPPDIGNHLPYIQFLFLSNNSFQGQIPESFCNASTLSLLDISQNNIVGRIPKCFVALSSNLRMLNFGGNKLQGHIANFMFPNSCALRFLDLNDNLLGGTIPKSLVNCQNLQVLNLGKNAFVGKFPCFLRKIATLRVMVLRSNKLHGSIGCPNSTDDWKMLHIADLAANNFSGTISATLLNSWEAMTRDEAVLGPEFGHLFFQVLENYHPMSLKEALPSVNKYLAAIVIKILGNMSISLLDEGFIDSTSVSVDNDRYDDSITIVNKGQQMKLVKIQNAFTYVDMSMNSLEGTIPNELMQFKALNALNLSHNKFTGHIPASVGNLKNLESLDLSNNYLNGEIPQELSTIFFLEYMNLSFNHLVGRIPLGTQIQSFDIDSFERNEGLCGLPLTKKCNNDELPPPASETPHSHNESSIDWSFLSIELGIIFGFGIFILPLICLKKLRLWYSKYIDEMLYRFIHQLDFVYELHEGKRYRTLRWRY